MKIILSNVIEITEPSDNVLKYCKEKLTFVNPEYGKRKKMGYWVGKIPKDIKLYCVYNDKLYVPYGFFEELWKVHPYKEDYVDYTTTKYADIKSNIVLRDYQQPCVRAFKEHCTGILSLKVGCGKTESILHTISELKQKTLFMAHTIDLVNQAKERSESKMSCKTSLITDGKIDISGDIVFGTIQSVYKFIENGALKQDDFGMIVMDEVQHISASPKSLQMFRTVFEYFSARYKAGLSAEVHRADGLQNCILSIVGNVIYGMERDKNYYKCMYDNKELMRIPVDKFQVPCHVIVRETEYNVDGKDIFDPNGGTIVYAKLITDMAMDEKRNNFIISDLKKMKGSTIILSDRVEQAKYLCSMIDNSVEIDGSTPKKVRKQALDDVRSGKIKYLFSSYALAKEGLDIPRLENIVLATPIKDFGVLVQSCGRIQRPFEGKTIAYVYDYVDRVALSYRYFQKRRAIYRKNNWEIDNMYLGGK